MPRALRLLFALAWRRFSCIRSSMVYFSAFLIARYLRVMYEFKPTKWPMSLYWASYFFNLTSESSSLQPVHLPLLIACRVPFSSLLLRLPPARTIFSIFYFLTMEARFSRALTTFAAFSLFRYCSSGISRTLFRALPSSSLLSEF